MGRTIFEEKWGKWQTPRHCHTYFDEIRIAQKLFAKPFFLVVFQHLRKSQNVEDIDTCRRGHLDDRYAGLVVIVDTQCERRLPFRVNADIVQAFGLLSETESDFAYAHIWRVSGVVGKERKRPTWSFISLNACHKSFFVSINLTRSKSSFNL